MNLDAFEESYKKNNDKEFSAQDFFKDFMQREMSIPKKKIEDICLKFSISDNVKYTAINHSLELNRIIKENEEADDDSLASDPEILVGVSEKILKNKVSRVFLSQMPLIHTIKDRKALGREKDKLCNMIINEEMPEISSKLKKLFRNKEKVSVQDIYEITR